MKATLIYRSQWHSTGTTHTMPLQWWSSIKSHSQRLSVEFRYCWLLLVLSLSLEYNYFTITWKPLLVPSETEFFDSYKRGKIADWGKTGTRDWHCPARKPAEQLARNSGITCCLYSLCECKRILTDSAICAPMPTYAYLCCACKWALHR